MNEPLLLRDDKVDFASNHAPGILGGISIGAPIVCTISVKPTPSIAKQQRTVDLVRDEAAEIAIKGRHVSGHPAQNCARGRGHGGPGAGRSPAAAEGGADLTFFECHRSYAVRFCTIRASFLASSAALSSGLISRALSKHTIASSYLPIFESVVPL